MAVWPGRVAVLVLCLSFAGVPAGAQGTAVLQGRVTDSGEGALAAALVSVRNRATRSAVSVRTDPDGRYRIAALAAGIYQVTAEAGGFRGETIEELHVDVGRILVRDFRLVLGQRSEVIVVRAEVPLVDRVTAAVGHVVTAAAVQQAPLNGRHFIDLGLLAPASVAPSQTGFSSRPIRGVGALAFNTAGNREEAVGFVINGVMSNNLTFGSLIFEPPLGSIQQLRIDNSAFGAEHGHVSGAIVSVVTRAGTDEVRGDAFEFVRNDAFDARNFFELTSNEPSRFQRNQFGGAAGGPLVRGRTFFFAAYEGLRQRQDVDMNAVVPSDAERAAPMHPAIRQLLPLIPRANVVDASGRSRFVGSGPAIVDTDRWTIDVRHSAGPNDRLHLFYGGQRVHAREPGSQGNNTPGFGSLQRPTAGLFTVVHSRVGGSGMNEARFGRAHLNGGTYPATAAHAADFGIGTGVTSASGLPQMIVAGALNFGGPGTLPMGRFDVSYVFGNTYTTVRGRQTIRLGGEYRHFINENFAEGTGVINFPSMAAFLAGTANAYAVTLGERRSVVDQRAMSLFVQHQFAVHERLALDLGLRYEWHVTPTERHGRFVVFDAATASLRRVGSDVPAIYRQNNRNVEPRLGAAWTADANGHTVVRAAYARTVDQPGTTAVRDTASNPPFGVPLTASGSIPLATAIDATRPAGLAPATVDPGFRNASLDSWNVNVQRQLAPDMAATVGYLGSRGAHLRLSRNLNQPIDGVRPFEALAVTSPILPGTPLGNITQVESSGFSGYHGAWIAMTKRLSGGLHADASYTWSRSMDTNSLNSSGFAVQDSNDIPAQYGLSDFHARHRFVLNATYTLPFTGHGLTRGWRVSAVVQSQSGNPINIVTTNSSLNGTTNTVRPDLAGPIRIVGAVSQWFDPSAFVAVDRFGTLGRNVVIGPAFHNTDLAVVKEMRPAWRLVLQLRLDVFNLFNHPNLGPPGHVVGSPTFGQISRTRMPTGEAGSSRQIQFASRLSF